MIQQLPPVSTPNSPSIFLSKHTLTHPHLRVLAPRRWKELKPILHGWTGRSFRSRNLAEVEKTPNPGCAGLAPVADLRGDLTRGRAGALY